MNSLEQFLAELDPADAAAFDAMRRDLLAGPFLSRSATEQYRLRCKKARRQTIKRAAPPWANQFFIDEAYALARLRTNITGRRWHVDHIVPLHSPIVCGLHVETNMRVIPARQNWRKGNRQWPDMPTLQATL